MSSSESLLLSVACKKKPECATTYKDPIEKIKLTCEMQVQSLKCAELAKENPEWAPLMRRCDLDSLCKQNDDFLREQGVACLRGYKNAMIDLGISLKDMAVSLGGFIEKSWEGFKENNKKRAEFLRECDKLLSCKRDLVKDDHRYNKLSDADLEKYPATFLYIEAQDMKAYMSSIRRMTPKPYVPISERPMAEDVQLSVEQRNKLGALKNMVMDTLNKQYQRYSCYNALAQEELACYAIGNVIDPTILVGGYFLKGGRAAVAAGRGIKAEVTALEAAELAKATEATKIVEASRITESASAKTSGSTVTQAQRNADNSDIIAKRRKSDQEVGKNSSTTSSTRSAGFKDREGLIRKYLEYSPTTVAQNEKWISLANSGTKSKATFLDVENSQMKVLNDSLKDKNLVTGLTNYHKDLLLSNVKALEKEFPGLIVDPYSDFKSMRFSFSGKVPKDLEARLAKVFKETNIEFNTYLKENGIIRSVEKSDQWFRAGIGQSADQANLAARYSRQLSENELQAYSKSELQIMMRQKLSDIEKDRQSLRQYFGKTNLVSGQTFDTDVYDIVRKGAGDTTKISKDLANRFGTAALDTSQVKALERYVKAADDFSPGLYIAKRETPHFNEATMGGLSADMIGMGGANLKGTAEALAGKTNLDKVLESTRLAEKTVTHHFVEQKKAFQEVLQKSVDPGKLQTVCSGDDCVAIASKPLSIQDKESVMKNLAQTKYSGSFRLSFVSDGVKDASARNILATHGESVEKTLRKSLGSSMEPAKLKGLTFGVDMQTTHLNSGGVKLIVGQSPLVRLSAREREQIQKAFKEAVESLNNDLRAQRKSASYSAVN
ncbi:hypothetical protein AZI87_16435 [Bdellovibrio bacteriovorus]|uniref:Uncharacterized protein n=1 Tax=Bdellovibrio bacteriovorus TaxID=959 RepID=A0A161PQD7_BDEBC|nr:hypothetical protein AZI87_16435 [Bdellovibrio bacteriovorus]